jgi:hypothetical protein
MHNTTQTDRRILWQKNEIGIARTSNARVRKNLCLTISETRKKIRPDRGSYLLWAKTFSWLGMRDSAR